MISPNSAACDNAQNKAPKPAQICYFYQGSALVAPASTVGSDCVRYQYTRPDLFTGRGFAATPPGW